VNRLERLDGRYRSHQTARKGFTFGGGERARLIASLVGGPGLRVLDLGCRDGALTQHYVAGNTVVGMDVDSEALARISEDLGIETVWGDAEDRLPFPHESFDVVVAGELLEHLAEPSTVVSEARRVLAANGAFVGSVPNAFRLKGRIRFALGRQPETDPTHLHLFTPDDVRRLLLAEFAELEVRFVVGRYVRWHPRLMARDQVFRATGRAPG
jgi:SAM-dependent methyltransferase